MMHYHNACISIHIDNTLEQVGEIWKNSSQPGFAAHRYTHRDAERYAQSHIQRHTQRHTQRHIQRHKGSMSREKREMKSA